MLDFLPLSYRLVGHGSDWLVVRSCLETRFKMVLFVTYLPFWFHASFHKISSRLEDEQRPESGSEAIFRRRTSQSPFSWFDWKRIGRPSVADRIDGCRPVAQQPDHRKEQWRRWVGRRSEPKQPASLALRASSLRKSPYLQKATAMLTRVGKKTC